MNAPSLSPLATAPSARQDGTNATIWIAIGALWLALFVWCMAGWVTGPDFVANTIGRSQASADYVRFIHVMEVVGLVLTAWHIWLFLVRPRLRHGALTFDSLFFLACGALVLQEPWLNAIRPQLLYNDIFFNRGSWLGYLPGIVSPVAQKVPVPLAFAGLGYFYIVAGPSYCGSRFMTWLKGRRPDLTPLGLVARCFGGFVIFDLIIESFILRTGLFIYPSTIPQLTLFAGRIYQLPLYETASWAGTYTALASIHFFRNEAGETLAERGFAALAVPSPLAKFARWLAIMGLCQVAMFLTYNVPYTLWAFHGGPSTISAETHPWLTAGLCGTGTPYACPGPGVPIARRDTTADRISYESPAR